MVAPVPFSPPCSRSSATAVARVDTNGARPHSPIARQGGREAGNARWREKTYDRDCKKQRPLYVHGRRERNITKPPFLVRCQGHPYQRTDVLTPLQHGLDTVGPIVKNIINQSIKLFLVSSTRTLKSQIDAHRLIFYYLYLVWAQMAIRPHFVFPQAKAHKYTWLPLAGQDHA